MKVGFGESSYVTRVYKDPNGYVHMLGEFLGINASSLQISEGPAQYLFECFSADDDSLRIGRTRIRQSEYIEFEVPRGFTLVSACWDQQAYFCNGVRSDGTHVSIYPGGYQFRGLYPAGWSAMDILLNNRFARAHQLLRPQLMRATRELELWVADARCPAMERLLEEMIAIFDATAGDHTPANIATLGGYLLAFVSENLGPALDDALPPGNGHKAESCRRSDIVADAISYIADNLDRDLSAESLATALGVSYRSMHYAFSDALGVSPYRFILIKRLHAVRDILMSTDISIKDACYSHGFKTPSQFRKHYQRLFGETPSRTREQAEL